MTREEFIQAWGGEYRDNPLARFRQCVGNLKGYADLLLEGFADDGFRPSVAAFLEQTSLECRSLMKEVGDFLAISCSFQEATGNLYHGLHPTIDSILRCIHKMIGGSAREPFLDDLENMRLAGQTVRDLLGEIIQRGRIEVNHPKS